MFLFLYLFTVCRILVTGCPQTLIWMSLSSPCLKEQTVIWCQLVRINLKAKLAYMNVWVDKLIRVY